MTRLYMVQKCPFGHRAAIALREKNADFEVVFFEPGKRPQELEAVGPRAKSPTLFDGDARIYDSQVVLEYIEDRFPEPRLLPKDPVARAEVRMLIARYNDEVAPAFGALVFELLFAQQRDQTKIDAAKQTFLKTLPPWDEYLKGRTFAVGDALTLADITLYTFFASLKIIQAGVDMPSELPHLRAWFERVRVRVRASSALPAPS